MKNLFLAGFIDTSEKHENLSFDVPVEYIKNYYQEVAESFGALHQVAYKSDPQAMNQINELVSRQLAAQAAQEAGRLAAAEQAESPTEQLAETATPTVINIEEARRRVKDAA